MYINKEYEREINILFENGVYRFGNVSATEKHYYVKL